MNAPRHAKRLAACGLALALGAALPALGAEQAPPPAPAYGPGMMGYGAGPGMMGGYGMGPGMMGGYGMGPGMMGGYGMGPGMMSPFWGSGLDLTPEQQAKINRIQDETRKAHWALMGEMMNEQARLRDLYQAPKRDQAAIDSAYQAFGKLQQRMYDSAADAQKRMEAILTKEQQEKLRNYWRRGWAPAPAK
ncbi:Spy/CpxP family protein refolding chaperone [Thiobacillus sedimenti]|uniref:Spy/CpxP family protein refolding chaperone n=1 Tax=Thiobacillus sedimenti TaxID=3110231 RepID=A0ABZ1CLY5_9PROT|nr:Spy/CpxP family protein refolding chaperone [Thiobacillus sp. SCUT-2]WRS40395.1 Spy/CpxP family protein refolding chaperone [Thiobacillus sp. SCUT-2]